jgi:pimeloyl-ACP methyl ester carboxylesterase
MPHYFQFYTTFKENEDRLTIKKAVSELNIPVLIVHGDQDETVGIAEAKNLKLWNESAQLKIISGANHTFGSSQPWGEDQLPEHLAVAVAITLSFL